MALTKADFILREDVAAMAATDILNNKRVELFDGSQYQTGPIDLGEGILLVSSNYANPISTPVPVATETTFGGFKYTFTGGVLNLITV